MEQVTTLVPPENPGRSWSLPQQVRPAKNNEVLPLLKLKPLPTLGLLVWQKLAKIQCLHI